MASAITAATVEPRSTPRACACVCASLRNRCAFCDLRRSWCALFSTARRCAGEVRALCSLERAMSSGTASALIAVRDQDTGKEPALQ